MTRFRAPRSRAAIRRSRSTGRPVGEADWIAALEASTARDLAVATRAEAAVGANARGGRSIS
ncbi:MAG: hypothetical protein ACHP84_06020, partial [Caulobacterales bacterium]